ncbi:MAG TPA: enoyl-CoA hydratase [Candidatus Angelobacter sp.]|jgi:enoyl-CoA hydratase/carnithine racemase|nr:enoyl-CoA hydratase [Candidatus Angelobacter sp.]
MAEHIVVSIQDRILSIRLDRPEKKNALTRGMYLGMIEALEQAENDSAVRVVLITGTQDCFTAGNDLMDFANAKPGETSPAIVYLQTLAAAQKPVVAAVAGVAVGIGTTMLLHCDLVYASPDSRFQLPFVNLGLCPEAGSSVMLPELMGHRRAAELLLFGEPFSSGKALELGIINAVYPGGQLLEAATDKARQLAEKPPSALRTTKALLKRSASGAVAEAMARETEKFATLLQGPEAREAMMAFMQRRKPDFSKF